MSPARIEGCLIGFKKWQSFQRLSNSAPSVCLIIPNRYIMLAVCLPGHTQIIANTDWNKAKKQNDICLTKVINEAFFVVDLLLLLMSFNEDLPFA